MAEETWFGVRRIKRAYEGESIWIGKRGWEEGGV